MQVRPMSAFTTQQHSGRIQWWCKDDAFSPFYCCCPYFHAS
eukprot:TsM_000387900 transcript=TsM_000387900 gene=TsM_000387900